MTRLNVRFLRYPSLDHFSIQCQSRNRSTCLCAFFGCANNLFQTHFFSRKVIRKVFHQDYELKLWKQLHRMVKQQWGLSEEMLFIIKRVEGKCRETVTQSHTHTHTHAHVHTHTHTYALAVSCRVVSCSRHRRPALKSTRAHRELTLTCARVFDLLILLTSVPVQVN